MLRSYWSNTYLPKEIPSSVQKKKQIAFTVTRHRRKKGISVALVTIRADQLYR